jgi:hypothetical protein
MSRKDEQNDSSKAIIQTVCVIIRKITMLETPKRKEWILGLGVRFEAEMSQRISFLIMLLYVHTFDSGQSQDHD